MNEHGNDGGLLLEQLARLARVGSWSLAAEGERIEWSSSLRSLFAAGPEDDLPFAPGERERLAAALASALTHGGEVDVILRVPGRAGDERHLRLRGEVSADRGITGVAQDITEHVTAERAHAESVRQLEEAQRVARLGTYRFDVATGLWTPSPILEAIFGIVGLDRARDVALWSEIIHPDERSAMVEYLEDHVLGRCRPFDREYRIRRIIDGDVRWVHGLGELVLDDAGRPLTMIGTIRDVTARREAEEALRRSEALYHDLVETAQDLVWQCDRDGRYTYLNSAFETVFGYPLEEMLGRPFTDFQDKATGAADMAEFSRLMTGGSVRGYETVHKAKDGRDLHLVFNAKAVNDDQGRLVGTRGTAYDITERRRAEEEKLELERRLLHSQKLESLGLLAGGIAHDFNNLLMAVIGNLDLALLTLPENSSAEESIEQALHAAHHSTDLTRQMLAYSGRGKFLIEDLDINALVNENVKLLRATVSKNIDLELALDPASPFVHADGGQLQQVVLNLITNAAEAIGEGAGTVTVGTGVCDYDASALTESRIEDRPLPGRFAWVEVSDDGSGMDEETLERLFDPFYTTKVSGRGLGLSAVLGIVRGHSGAIFVRSAEGLGTSFRVLLPVATGGVDPGLRPPGPGFEAPLEARSQAPGTILVVDDEDVVRSLVRRMLERLGYGVLEAADGLEAANVFRDHRDAIAGVILDLSMPRVDGVKALRMLRQIEPSVRIILASGYDREDALLRFTDSGPTTFIHKPFRFAELRTLVAEVFEGT